MALELNELLKSEQLKTTLQEAVITSQSLQNLKENHFRFQGFDSPLLLTLKRYSKSHLLMNLDCLFVVFPLFCFVLPHPSFFPEPVLIYSGSLKAGRLHLLVKIRSPAGTFILAVFPFSLILPLLPLLPLLHKPKPHPDFCQDSQKCLALK